MRIKEYTCDCCPSDRDLKVSLIIAPIDYRTAKLSSLDSGVLSTLIEDLCMMCRDCLELLDPSLDNMSEWLCKRCVIREDEFWGSLIRFVEESYYEV